jgi:tetratricopeptide (TPR) repeat protein
LLITMLSLVGVTVIVLWRALRNPHLLVGWLWYVGTLVPVIGIVQVGSQALADRYTYIPSIGLFIMLAYSVMPQGNQRINLRLVAAFSVTLLLMLAVASRFQLEHWRNSEVLFRHALTVTTDNAVANYALGDYLAEERRFDEAEEYLAEAMRLRPHFTAGYKTLGLVRLALGKHESAYEPFEILERLEPENGSVHYTMGIILEKMDKQEEAAQKFERAVTEFRSALIQTPDDPSLMFNLATTLEKLGNRAEARPLYREAFRLQPDLLPPGGFEALLNSTEEP